MQYVTDRLLLRPMELDDAAALLSYRSIPEVNTYTYTPVWTSVDDAMEHIEELLPKMDDSSSGFCKWMICRRDTSEVVGEMMLRASRETSGSYEIGYMIHPDHMGHGFATEAARCAMRVGFEEWDVHRIYARIDEENIASVRVCQHLGMRQEARLIENDKRGDAWSTELVFAILDREWKARMEGTE